MRATTMARAREVRAVVVAAPSSRRRCRRWSVSTRARRGFLAERLRDEGEDAGDARARSGDDACVLVTTYPASPRAYAVNLARIVASGSRSPPSPRCITPQHLSYVSPDAKKTIKNVSFRTFTHKRSTPGKERGEYFVTYEASFTKGARGKTRVLAERARLRRDDETGEWKFVDAVALNPNTLDDVGGDPAGGARR